MSDLTTVDRMLLTAAGNDELTVDESMLVFFRLRGTPVDLDIAERLGVLLNLGLLDDGENIQGSPVELTAAGREALR